VGDKSSTIKKDFWPALSSNSVYLFTILAVFLIIELEISYYSHILAIVISLLAVFCKGLFDKLFWNFWKDLPEITHKVISIVCLSWFCYLISKALIPLIKEKYVDKSKD